MAKRRPPTVHGLSLIDKPAGMTSHDVVSRLRKQLQSAIATQVHARRTPVLEFRPDDAIRAAARIDEVLRNDPMHTRNLSDDTE